MATKNKKITVDDWMIEIEYSQRDHCQFYERAKYATERYRDENYFYTDRQKYGYYEDNTLSDVKYNILWSNISTLQPALYARLPNPNITRRYNDDDQLGRVASELLERVTEYMIKTEGFDFVMRYCRDDYLLVGRGQAWIRYVPHFQIAVREVETGMILEDGTIEIEQEEYEELDYEEVVVDYVHWKDFMHSPARVWEEVTWVARKVYLTQEEVRERFGNKASENLEYDYIPEQDIKDELRGGGSEREGGKLFRKAVIYEIWDKTTRKIYWLSKGYDEYLDEKEDPLKLKGFFPCPKPLLATTTNESVIPICDFLFYRDQAQELDDLTYRINLLLKALKVTGVYDASCDGLQRLYDEGHDYGLIPVENWNYLAKGGGLSGAIDFLPIQETMTVLNQLYQSREITKNVIYEITGISDVIRGSSDPRETATAQGIKGRFATLRLSDRQQTVQKFARDIISLVAEVVAEHFSDETILSIAGIQSMSEQDQMLAMQALQLLRNDSLRRFKVDVETDSTISTDQFEEKQQRIEFVQAVGNFLNQTMQLQQAAPAYAKVLGDIMMFGLRSFKIGRTLEGEIEDGMNNAVAQLQQNLQMQQQQQQQQQSPQQMKAQADAQAKQQEIAIKQQEAMANMQLEQQKAMNKANIDQQKAQTDMAIKAEKARRELEIEAAKLQGNLTLEQQKAILGVYGQ